tara:strand:+ start:1401 stop:1508 length:108 start_codon:yes stop_codon:yes gene_type:complete
MLAADDEAFCLAFRDLPMVRRHLRRSFTKLSLKKL